MVALSATAFTVMGQSAQALTLDIDGGVTLPTAQFPGYGTNINQDKVVNSGTAGQTVVDTNSVLGSSWIASSSGSTAVVQVGGLAPGNT